jgi:hypothetical protein
MYNFAKEIHASATSPVWSFMPRRSKMRAEINVAPPLAVGEGGAS